MAARFAREFPDEAIDLVCAVANWLGERQISTDRGLKQVRWCELLTDVADGVIDDIVFFSR